MKVPWAILAAMLIISTALVAGCVTGSKSALPTADSEQLEPPDTDVPPYDTPDPDSSGPLSKGPGPGQDGSSPKYRQASSPAAPHAPELRDKDEINTAALQFARDIKNVKHIKTCFSTVYGGWYLMLYIEKGKVTSLQQYSWNPRNREWEYSYQLREVPAKQVEFHLKGEVGDEKCFILKK